jgi:hypothetical protein
MWSNGCAASGLGGGLRPPEFAAFGSASAQAVTRQVRGTSELRHEANSSSAAAAAEPTFPDGVAGILTIAEELLI